MAGLSLLETCSPSSATGPQNHLTWLFLPFSILLLILISQSNSLAGRAFLHTCCSHLPAWPSLKEFWKLHVKVRDETKGKWAVIRQNLNLLVQHLAARLSIVLSTTKSMVEIFAQEISKPIKRSQRGWPKVTWWAFLYLPTRVAAHELKSGDDVTGYGLAPIGAGLMSMLLVWMVCGSVRWYMNRSVDGVRRPLEKLSYVVLVAGVLAAIVIMTLAISFEGVYNFKENTSIADL